MALYFYIGDTILVNFKVKMCSQINLIFLKTSGHHILLKHILNRQQGED